VVLIPVVVTVTGVIVICGQSGIISP